MSRHQISVDTLTNKKQQKKGRKRRTYDISFMRVRVLLTNGTICVTL